VVQETGTIQRSYRRAIYILILCVVALYAITTISVTNHYVGSESTEYLLCDYVQVLKNQSARLSPGFLILQLILYVSRLRVCRLVL
jgi:hypothetical protein